MQSRNLFSVVDQDAALFRSNQKMAGSIRQNRSDSANLGVIGENLAEAAAVEGQEPVVRGGKNEFRFAGIGENRRGQCD